MRLPCAPPQLMVGIQAKYPDLYAVLKFVPKKNGLNPLLAQLSAEGTDPESMRIDELRPREVRRRLDDLRRTLGQSWLLLSTYLTLPGRPERDDFLWSARTVVEKVKTDQRSRAIELLCLGFYSRDAAMYPLIVVEDEEGERWPLKSGFEANFGVEVRRNRAHPTWPPFPSDSSWWHVAGVASDADEKKGPCRVCPTGRAIPAASSILMF